MITINIVSDRNPELISEIIATSGYKRRAAVILFILFLIGLAIISWLLVAPLQLQIDTQANHYQLVWKSIGYGKLVMYPEKLGIKLKILFWNLEWQLFPAQRKKQSGPKSESQPPASRDEKKRRRPSLPIRAMLRTFEVKRLRLHIDTDDFIINSYLYPVFYFLNRNREERDLRINYQGEALFQLIVENRLYRLLFAFVRSQFR